jgi:enoyl-CoA hydratase/carnithine racemase
VTASILETALAPGLLRWTLHHPRKRNALTPDMLAWLERRSNELAGEVVILTGDGDTSFCAGFDLDALPDAPLADLPPDDPLARTTAAVRRADATFIAALHGHIFGAGVELACSCDLRIARDDTRLTIPAARLGIVYHADGVAALHNVLGLALTQRLLLLGETLGIDELQRAGAVHAVRGGGDLIDAAVHAATRLRAGAPASLRAHRDRLRGLIAGTPPGPGYDAARLAAFASDDHREGRAAARERRPPRFTGR